MHILQSSFLPLVFVPAGGTLVIVEVALDRQRRQQSQYSRRMLQRRCSALQRINYCDYHSLRRPAVLI